MTPLHAVPATCWLTASIGHAPLTTPQELRALGDHLSLCRHHGGRWSRLRCGAESAARFVTARSVTTLAGAALLGALVWLAV